MRLGLDIGGGARPIKLKTKHSDCNRGDLSVDILI